ncbi:hypothetical protein [Streptomyces sp. ISL-1]|nr:hypothetical protein [Streptomyces sp. ISL-1]
MAGKISDDEYFKKVNRSVVETLTSRTVQHAISALIRFLSRS